MKKIIAFLCLLLSIGVVFVWIITNKRPNDSLINTPAEAVLHNARPLLWLDDQYMLVGLGKKIMKYDISKREVADVVSDPYYASPDECFTPDEGVFIVKEPEVTINNGQKHISYLDTVYRWVQDWNKPTLFKDFKDADWKKKDFADRNCSRYRYQEPDWSEHKNRTILIRNNGIIKKVELEKSSLGIDYSFDRTSRIYFWYDLSEDFDSSHKNWPLNGWWVSSNGQILQKIMIPRGPWVRDFSVFYSLSFFSCGPSCYSHMKMYVGGGRIYIYVWGEAVDDKVKGVYELNMKEQKWTKLIIGSIDNGLMISPGGCKISYASDNTMYIVDVCKESTIMTQKVLN